MTSERDFVERSLINEQENVRDYQRFSDSTSNPKLKQMFKEFADSDASQAKQMKNLLENWDNG